MAEKPALVNYILEDHFHLRQSLRCDNSQLRILHAMEFVSYEGSSIENL